MKRKILLFATLVLTFALVVCASALIISAEDTAPMLSIEKFNLSFEDNIYLKYAVKFSGVEDSEIHGGNIGMLYFTDSESEFIPGTEDYSSETTGYTEIDGVKYYVFEYTHLAAKQLTDYIYSVAYLEYNGKTYYSEPVKYSALEYAYHQLGKTAEGTTKEELKQLLNNMLAYGASAQQYFDYKEDRLATDEFYQVNVVGGTLEDGFTSGLYSTTDEVTIIAPESDGELVFAGWENSDGEIVYTDPTAVVENLTKNETFTARMVSTCPHISTVIIPGKEATCTEPGLTEGEKCAICDDIIIKQNTISPSHTEITIEGIPATCTTPGLSNGKYCTVCETTTLEQYVIDALGHNYVDYICSLCDKEMPGLYGEDGELVASWDDLVNVYGLDIEREYDLNSAYSISSSPINVLHNYSELSDGIKLVIPDGITTIGAWLFTGCDSLLKEIVFPNTVTTIVEYAFAGALFDSVHIPPSVTSVGDLIQSAENIYISDIAAWCNIKQNISGGASINMNNLYLNSEIITELVIPDGVTQIPSYAFYGIDSITSVTIPNTVTSIGQYAFYDCDGLTNIEIPGSITSVGSSAFDECDNLKFNEFNNAYYLGNGQNPYHLLYKAKSTSITSCVLRNNAAVICSNAFLNCTAITSITVPDSVINIGDSAFEGCTSLSSISLPDGLTSIGRYAFRNCSSLRYITIPDGVTRIEDETFYGCTSLSSVSLPDGLTSIGRYAFRNCSNLGNITIPGSVTSMDYAFYYCTGLTKITIGNGITGIGSSTFEGCTSLSSVSLPDGLTSIGGGAFENCSSLQNIFIPNSVTYIGGSAFYNCTKLSNINIPSNVTQINGYTFVGCTSLVRITIPNSVTSIGSYAFGNCFGLTDVYYKGTEDEWNAVYISDTGNSYLTNATIHYN